MSTILQAETNSAVHTTELACESNFRKDPVVVKEQPGSYMSFTLQVFGVTFRQKYNQVETNDRCLNSQNLQCQNFFLKREYLETPLLRSLCSV